MGLEEIAKNNSIIFIISLISLLCGMIGVIGIIYTIKSYYSQKRTEHAYEDILNKANQDWKGKYTEEEIKRLNEQLNDLTAQINNDIPQKAYKALLEYKEYNLRKELEALYVDYKQVKKEMSSLNLEGKLSPEIEAFINNEINKKTGNYDTNRKLLLLIAVILLFSIPSVYDMFFRFSDYVIWITGAHISVSLLSFYIVCLFACTLLFLSLRLHKIYLWILNNRKKSIVITIAMLLLWVVICYLITYAIFFKSMIIQVPLGILSIFLFACAFMVIKLLLSK